MNKKILLFFTTVICLPQLSLGQTYTGQFYSPSTMGMYTDQWFNLRPQSGVNSSNNWNIHHQDGSSLFSLWFASTQPYIQVGQGRTTNFYVNGNVGIGTTSPGAKLDINAGTGSFDGLRLYKGANADRSWISFWQGSGTNGVYRLGQTQWDDGMVLYNGGTDPANPGSLIQKWSSSGSVGIGTTSPDGFQINKSLSSEASQGASNIRMGVMGNAARLIFDTQGTTPFQIDNTGGQLRIFNPGVVRMVINTNGNVGIGTTDPGSYKLAVEGKIGAREVNVTTASWPDYVFEKNYKLPSLEDIKNYIDQNQHLPEVPSAKEVEKNGVNLGEMNALLLKKIEELTIYMIEANKKMEEATRKIDNQQQQIEELKQAVKKN